MEYSRAICNDRPAPVGPTATESASVAAGGGLKVPPHFLPHVIELVQFIRQAEDEDQEEIGRDARGAGG
jgi:hypothetical protein